MLFILLCRDYSLLSVSIQGKTTFILLAFNDDFIYFFLVYALPTQNLTEMFCEKNISSSEAINGLWGLKSVKSWMLECSYSTSSIKVHTMTPDEESLVSLNVYFAFSSSSYFKQVSEYLWAVRTHAYQIGIITDLWCTPNDLLSGSQKVTHI